MSVELFHSTSELRARLSAVRRSGGSVGLVPTMGALHEGHGRLIEEAVRESECAAVSIFVNPIQFNQQEDYEVYPRTLPTDLQFCQARGARVVFAPSLEEMYPGPLRTFVEVTGVTDHLCGPFRPGHFRGVATVVAKLFHIVQPDRAYFGQKDAQQLAVIRRMVRDLDLPIQIVAVPTVREADGLAISSRNVRLSREERRAAPVLFEALEAAAELIAGGVSDPAEVSRQAFAILQAQPRARVEYFEIVDPEEMQPVEWIAAPVLVAGAIWLGSTRLIDNLPAKPETSPAG